MFKCTVFIISEHLPDIKIYIFRLHLYFAVFHYYYFIDCASFKTETIPTMLKQLKNMLFLTIVIPGGFRLARNLTSGSQVYFLKPHMGTVLCTRHGKLQLVYTDTICAKVNCTQEKCVKCHRNCQ